MKIKDMDLTPEQEAVFRDYSPIKVSSTFLYVPRVYRMSKLPKSAWPIFELRRLAGTDIVESEDILNGSIEVTGEKRGQVNVRRGEYTVAICKRGIKGWSNYYSGEAEIKFESTASIDCLPPVLLYELSNAITKRNELTEEELSGLG